ncbi:MAG: sigma-70 family RNA polymerase sigma factor [Alistipes sp.]|jgi:RNA polymerase sigma-70 factor (ECF subfamily)|nr:sigma-70 family RNA polymerase sigma factor [Alistipes sp.]
MLTGDPIFDTETQTRPDDDRLLAEFIETGDAALLGELYTRHMPLVYGLCLKYLGRAADAEDATMELFEELVDKVARQRIRNFRTWLWSVARNHCLQRLRREKRRVRVDFDDRFMESAPLVHLLSEGGDEAALAALEKCVEKLPERQREAVEMFFMERRSYADIADATLGEVKRVKSYIQNGKRNLRLCMERRGVRL